MGCSGIGQRMAGAFDHSNQLFLNRISRVIPPSAKASCVISSTLLASCTANYTADELESSAPSLDIAVLPIMPKAMTLQL